MGVSGSMLNKNTIIKAIPDVLVIVIFVALHFYLETTNQQFLSFVDNVNAVQNAPENYDVIYEIAMLNRKISGIGIFGFFFCGVFILKRYLCCKKT